MKPSAGLEAEVGARDIAVTWLGDEASKDPALVGNKAASLGRLAGRWPVPPGFCLPLELHGVLTGLEAVERTQALETIVSPRYEMLASKGEPVAVRSSSVDEDSESVSFAGQYRTVLGADGVQAVCEAVLACYESAETDRIQAYRQEHGLSEGSPMGVLVQQLVTAEVSGVAFSTNPITGDDSEVMINASWGLGSAVVDGLVTPDVYTVAKEGLSVTTRHAADKDVKVVAARGAVEEEPVEAGLRSELSLGDGQCREVGEMIVELENEMGWPVDVEFAYKDGELFVLQCRPVTTY